MFCPTKDQTLAALLALLPRGRAWQTNEGGPEPYYDAGFDKHDFEPEDFDTESREGSILFRYWSAVAEVFNYAEQRLCALAREMFCATQIETREQWMIEYGLPDDCDPFPDLCDKVAATGGARCEYFNERIARKGWKAECFERRARCGAQTGCAQVGAPKTMTGGSAYLGLAVRVHVGDVPDVSPASDRFRRPLAGRFRAGWRPSCDTEFHPSIVPVRCLMERIVPAHVEVQYVI